MKAILGKKIGMTQMFQNDKVIPVTLIEAGPCKVVDRKTTARDGYEALQVGYEALPDKRKLKSQKGKEFRYVREFPVLAGDIAPEAQDLTVSLFQEGDTVKVSGTSKGKGYAGAVKKWGVHGKNNMHGMKHEERGIGSIGQSFPERVTPGKKMAGRMGSARVSLKSVKVVKIDPERNMLIVRGAIPGRSGSLLEIRTI
ncbi:MAG: 50S ribosomal protein L3 [Candidatus Wildermuthbacteria bacterium]|nr:50S ribosomal protein L3 [Candidatus Wildermuthbacteria bacterium]